MRIETDMPLSSLIEKLLRGEAAEFHDEDFRTYVDSKMGNNHELLQQALNEIEDAIDIPELLCRISMASMSFICRVLQPVPQSVLHSQC